MMKNDSYNIGLFIDTSRIVGRGILRGFANYSKMHSTWMLNPTSVNNKHKLSLSNLKKSNYDALVIVEQNIPDEIHDFIQSNNIPSVIKCDCCDIKLACNIVSDNFKIGSMAADYFLKKGFTNFAYCGISETNWSVTRKNKFIESIVDAGFDNKNIYCKEFPRHLTTATLRKAELWLEKLPKPIALLADNDEFARKIIDICNRTHKINVPFDISVLGIDNDDLVCDISNPPISSIARNFSQVGFEAAEWIDAALSMDFFEAKNIVLEPIEIITRQSTDIYATDDDNIKAALEYIKKNANKDITVDDVAIETAVSRRSLERRFMQVLHTTINQEIRRVRNDLIAQFLENTDLSISEIADKMGFKSNKHIARYFAYTKNISPLSYRKISRS
ncbi:MAG: substrate-binding domain-containing protein [Sedimentisphaeraceae bacterium JB056]